MRASRSDQIWWAKISSAWRRNRRDCNSSSDPPAARLRDNVCFDLFALFGAVQTPATSKTRTCTARTVEQLRSVPNAYVSSESSWVLLNYPAQSSKRDTQRSGYRF